jgi:hypothetical protein
MPRISRQYVSFSQGPQFQEGEPIPDIEFEPPKPPLEVCDQALGQYVRCWGYVETAHLILFIKLLGAHSVAAQIIVSSAIDQRTLREIASVLANQRLAMKRDRIKLNKLLERLRIAANIRNRITHGTWRVKITRGNPNTAKWERYYQPPDFSLQERLHAPDAKQQFKDEYIFSVERLIQLAVEADKLARDINRFTEGVSIAPFRDMQPVKFSTTPG